MYYLHTQVHMEFGYQVCGEVCCTSGVLCSIRCDRQIMVIQMGVCLGVAQVQFGIFVICIELALCVNPCTLQSFPEKKRSSVLQALEEA